MDTFLILLALAFSIRYVQAGHDLFRASADYLEATKRKIDALERRIG